MQRVSVLSITRRRLVSNTLMRPAAPSFVEKNAGLSHQQCHNVYSQINCISCQTSKSAIDINAILPCSIRQWLLGAGLQRPFKGSTGNRAFYLVFVYFIDYISTCSYYGGLGHLGLSSYKEIQTNISVAYAAE